MTLNERLFIVVPLVSLICNLLLLLTVLAARPDTGIFGEEGYAVFVPQDYQTEAA